MYAGTITNHNIEHTYGIIIPGDIKLFTTGVELISEDPLHLMEITDVLRGIFSACITQRGLCSFDLPALRLRSPVFARITKEPIAGTFFFDENFTYHADAVSLEKFYCVQFYDHCINGVTIVSPLPLHDLRVSELFEMIMQDYLQTQNESEPRLVHYQNAGYKFYIEPVYPVKFIVPESSPFVHPA